MAGLGKPLVQASIAPKKKGSLAFDVNAGLQKQSILGKLGDPDYKESSLGVMGSNLPPKKAGSLALDINAPLQKQAVLGNVMSDSQDSPRSKAAKLMKRQAGIGQLTTRHVEEEPLI